MNIASSRILSFTDIRGDMFFINTPDMEQFISINKRDVFRGIHRSPYAKTIYCLTGSIIDYIISFPDITVQKISMKAGDTIHIPAGYGHGYLTLEDNTSILYQLSGKYDPTKDLNYNYADPIFDLKLPENIILSEKDKNNPYYRYDYAILGSSGFLGSEMVNILKFQNKIFTIIPYRLEEMEKIEKYLTDKSIKYLISAAGISGKPTVGWCETNRIPTLEVNLTRQLQLCEICNRLGIHLTIFGSGLVFKNTYPPRVLTENNIPDLDSVYYSHVRGLLEKSITPYSNILYLRILYPLTGNGHSKCFLQKMSQRTPDNRDICLTIVPDLFQHIPDLIERKITGILNFVNPGVINLQDLIHTGIVSQSEKLPTFFLDSSKLQELCPDIRNISDYLKTL